MTDRGLLFYFLVGISLWFMCLWISQPKYEDGVYVPVRVRLQRIFSTSVGCGVLDKMFLIAALFLLWAIFEGGF